MLTLDISVPEGRDRAGIATLKDGWSTVATGSAAATVARELAARNGNARCDPMRPWGDPCAGDYLLIATAGVPDGCRTEYGGTLLAFEPQSGPALDAESFGRLGLALYAGPAGRDGRLRCTQGGVRLSDSLMALVVQRVEGGADVALRISLLSSPSWWQFWRSMPALPALSGDKPHFAAPPLDEATLLAEAMRNAVSRKRAPIGDDRSDDWRNDRDTSNRPSGDQGPYQGQGGRFGGAGASGSWDDAAAGSKAAAGSGSNNLPQGVDASGRILAGAAGAAMRTANAQTGVEMLEEADLKPDSVNASNAGDAGNVIVADAGSSSGQSDHTGGGTAY